MPNDTGTGARMHRKILTLHIKWYRHMHGHTKTLCQMIQAHADTHI